MKTWMCSLALIAGLSGYAPVIAEDPPAPPVADNPAKDAEAARKEQADKFKANLEKFKADAAAEGADKSLIELLETAKELGEYAAAEEAVKLFKDKNAKHENMTEVDMTFADCMLASGDLVKAKAAVDVAVKTDATTEAKVELLSSLMTIQSIYFDFEAAEATVDAIGELYAGTPGIEKQVKQAKKSLKNIGKPFDHISAKDIDGKAVDTKNLEGKVVLIDFMASW